ncbi:hypothetical protein BDV06DRAFT_211764 [Aspergillus oleicola]
MHISQSGVELIIWGVVFTCLTGLLSPYEIWVQAKLVTASSVTWLVSTTACKGSMLTLYLSLFRISRQSRIAIYISCGVAAAYFNPVSGGGCRDVRMQQISSISANILLDFAIALLSIPVLWNLRMPLRSNLTITAMFLMGLSAVGVLAWRLRLTDEPLPEPDLSREIARTALPSGLEIWLSFIVVSLPALAPLFRRYVEPLLPHRGSTPDGGRQLRKAEHTIGSTPRMRSAGDIMLDSLLNSNPSSTALVAPERC